MIKFSFCNRAVFAKNLLEQIRHCVYNRVIEAQNTHTTHTRIISFLVPVGSETLRIHARVRGAQSDAAVVFIPGQTDSSASFEAILDLAAQRSSEFTYISFDIAWGKSDISRFPYTKSHQLAIITAFLEHIVLKEFADSIHLVGHSMGAELALMKGLAEKAKKTCDSDYQSYISSITAAAPATYPRKLQLETFDFISLLPERAVQLLGKGLTPTGIKKIINGEISRHNGRGLSDEDFQLMHENMVRNDGIVRIFDIQKHMHYLRGSEFLQQYPRIGIPLQFILGDADRKISRNTIRDIPRDFSDHPAIIYPDCSHFIHYQYPDRLARDVIRFAEQSSKTRRITTAS